MPRTAWLFAPAGLLLFACGNGSSTATTTTVIAGSSSGAGGHASAASSSASGPATGSGAGAATSGSGGAGGSAPMTPIAWEALPATGAPAARYNHTAVWTGFEMVVWGGLVDGSPSVTATGGSYHPTTKTWTPTQSAGAPPARHSHTAVWTGSKMLIWGGYGATALATTGGIYDPVTDSWAPMSTTGQPSPRTMHSALWTGSKMIVWGGDSGSGTLGNGGIYNPAADTWAPLASAAAPSQREAHVAVWTGSQMIVWGGTDTINWLDSGATFSPDPAPGGSWVGATQLSGAPSKREQATGVWTSTDMLIWGGWTGGPYEDTGGLLSPATGGGSWVATAATLAPEARAEHVSVWAKDELVVWGGCGGDSCGTIFDDGGRFVPDPTGGHWVAVAAQPAFAGRRAAQGVYTGTSIIAWGGRDGSDVKLATGAESPL